MAASNSWWWSYRMSSCRFCQPTTTALFFGRSRTLKLSTGFSTSRSFRAWSRRRSNRIDWAKNCKHTIFASNIKNRRCTTQMNPCLRSKKRWTQTSTMACSKSRSTTGSKALWKWTNHTSWWCNSPQTARRGRILPRRSSPLSNATTSIWWSPTFRSFTIESCFHELKVSSIRHESTKCRMLQLKPTSTIKSKSWGSKLKDEFPTCSRRARFRWIVTWDRWRYWLLTTSIMKWASSWFFKREIFM